MRGRWIWDQRANELVSAEEWARRQNMPARSEVVPMPHFVRDCIELKSMVDGKMYTSKASLRRSYREKGYIEVGNEWLNNEPKKPAPKIDRKGIRESIGKAFNRVGVSIDG
jgi:hypothetical protein